MANTDEPRTSWEPPHLRPGKRRRPEELAPGAESASTRRRRVLKSAGVIGLAYGVVLLAVGLMGHATAGSLASAVAGSVLGVAVFVSAWAMLRGNVGGWCAALGVAAVLTLYFGIQSWGRGFMPAGLMAALSLIAAALFVGLSPLRLRRRRV